MNYTRRCARIYSFYLLLFLVLSSSIGCISNATRLSSLKANYNEGKWGYVLGTAHAQGAYSADEVIKAAGDDTLTADQAKLIKARALMHAFIQDKLAAGADANHPDITQALDLIKELLSKDFNLSWMNVELMATMADYFYLTNNYPAAFDAYDYLLNYAKFDSLDASHRQYIRRWAEMKRQLKDMATTDTYSKYADNQFKKTYAIVIKKFPDDITVVKVGIMILNDEGQPRAAVQRAMLAHFTAAKNPKTQKQFVKEINEIVDSIINDLAANDPEKNRLKTEYKNFTNRWDATPK